MVRYGKLIGVAAGLHRYALNFAVELPRGITGFRHVRDSALPQCHLRAFLAQCHVAARLLRGIIILSETPVRHAANFSRVTFELPGGQVSVLLNSIAPVVAFAEPPREGSSVLHFVDHAALADSFGASGEYCVLPATEARSPLVADTCRNLAEAELEQIRYWKPQTIGEVIYNHWD